MQPMSLQGHRIDLFRKGEQSTGLTSGSRVKRTQTQPRPYSTPAGVNSANCKNRIPDNPNRPTRLRSTKGANAGPNSLRNPGGNGGSIQLPKIFSYFFPSQRSVVSEGSSRRILPRELGG